MTLCKTKYISNKTILSLGADSDGGFSVFQNGTIYHQAGFGDLLIDDNFAKYSNSITAYLRKNKLKPDVILVDLHPLFKTVELGEILAKKYEVEVIKIQHHLAHIFSAYGEYLLNNKVIDKFTGVACDGTGFGLDEKIWGGEIFELQIKSAKAEKIERVAHLENQVLIGGEMAIREPARVLISVFGKFLSKDEVFGFVKKYHSRNEFELLFNQLQEGFNCVETSSTGRVLDAVAVLLCFSDNQISSKHEAIKLLEENSGLPFEIEPEIFFDKNTDKYILKTTPLFQYLIKNINKDKKRLAGTAQLYIAKGLWEIVKKIEDKIFFAGGMANNKIISEYLIKKGVFVNRQIARGDGGISFGQIHYYLANIK